MSGWLWVSLFVASGCSAPVADAGPSAAVPSVAQPAAVQTAAAQPATAQPATAQPAAHPGQITFVEPDGSEQIKPAAGVPESIRWATVEGARVPVVRIVRTGTGGFMEITRYGPKGQFIDVTATVRPSPK